MSLNARASTDTSPRPLDDDAARPVARGDIAGGRGELLERTASRGGLESAPPATASTKDDAADQQQPAANFVHELLRGLPVLQQNEPPHVSRLRPTPAGIRRRRTVRRRCAESPAGRRTRRARRRTRVRPSAARFALGEAAGRQRGRPSRVDVRVRHLGEPPGHRIVQRVADRQRAENFFGEARRLRHDQEQPTAESRSCGAAGPRSRHR